MDFNTLLEQSEDQRTSQWEEDFLNLFPKQNVVLDSEESKSGPDHWPYLFTRNHPEAKDSVRNILHWLSDKGIGLAFNAQKDLPDYIFTYGMIWHYREMGYFHSQIDQPEVPKSAVFKPGQEILSGPPSAEYIPQYVRDILKELFSNHGLKEEVRWLVISGDEKHYDLCFSLESLGNPRKEEHLDIAESFSWFFPSHFSIVLVSEEHLPPFYGLHELN